VILRLESADLAALLESAQAQLRVEQARLEGARARLALAETDVKRQRDLASTNDIPRSVLDSSESEHLQAQSALHQTEQAIEIARAHILRAQKDLENAVVTAPIDGTITRLDAEVGETVVVGTLNNPGSVIMEIADLSTMLLKARVDEANVAPVRAGQRARVYVNAYPDRVFEGTVERVELLRKVDPTDRTGYFETEILMHLGEGDRLYSGLTGNAEIEVQTIRDVLKVPSQAVVDRRVDELPAEVRTSQWVDPKKAYARVVYAVTEAAPPADGAPAPAAGGGPGPSSPGQPGAGKGAKPAGPVYTVRPVPVSTGSSDLTHTVILGGVGQGERIIVGPYKALVELKPGQTVVEEPGGAPPSPAAPPAPAGGGAGS
ncbi:MAG TPA: efflux RND transporter periplasmic adaptor subunit, partial [Phycisphaerales bacterium]|nr:efflux RND transporter periplasmic adaptor subunit [Phycisphaerales bacterium]